MSLRDELIPIVDDLRAEVVDVVAGLRLDTVTVRHRQWLGGQIGRGSYTDTDTVLAPRPKVGEPEPRRNAGAAGVYEEGDLKVSRISLTYSRAELGEGPSAATEVVWLIGTEAYRLVSLDEGYLQWEAHLRRVRGR